MNEFLGDIATQLDEVIVLSALRLASRATDDALKTTYEMTWRERRMFRARCSDLLREVAGDKRVVIETWKVKS